MKPQRSRISQLFSKVRSQTITAAEQIELAALEAEESVQAAKRPCQIHKSIWDLPIAKGMWESDMQDLRR